MSSMTIALVTFGCIFSGALVGMFLRATVPEHHLSHHSTLTGRDIETTFVRKSARNKIGETMAKRKTLFNSANGIKRREFIRIAATAVAAVAVPVLAQVQTDVGTLDKEQAAKGFPSKPPYSPYAGRDFPTRPFFGDTHLHTSFSMDAGAFGARLGPKEAYRFAKGEEIMASSGQRVKLSRPLD